MKNYKLVNGKKVEMSKKEYTDFDNSRKKTIDEIKKIKKQARKQYLEETDKYVIESIDTGVPYSDDIRIKRQKARQEIEKIKNSKTIDELNEINNNF